MTHRSVSIGVWSLHRLPILIIASIASLSRQAPAQAPAPAAPVTATVAGRIAMLERSREPTTDLGNTVIYLVPLDTASPALSPASTSIAMNGRAFVPRLRIVTPGSRVAFPNQDPFSHNIFSTTPGAAFDLGLYPSGKSKDARFRRAGAFPVYCNIHPRMTAYVVVAPTPWFTQAGNDGRWSIEGVPTGRYKLHVWHERAKESETEVIVTSSGVSGLATQLDARGFRFAQHKNKFGKDYDKTGKDRY
jgi:plastocyanin